MGGDRVKEACRPSGWMEGRVKKKFVGWEVR